MPIIIVLESCLLYFGMEQVYLTFDAIDSERWFTPILKDKFKPDLLGIFVNEILIQNNALFAKNRWKMSSDRL